MASSEGAGPERPERRPDASSSGASSSATGSVASALLPSETEILGGDGIGAGVIRQRAQRALSECEREQKEERYERGKPALGCAPAVPRVRPGTHPPPPNWCCASLVDLWTGPTPYGGDRGPLTRNGSPLNRGTPSGEWPDIRPDVRSSPFGGVRLWMKRPIAQDRNRGTGRKNRGAERDIRRRPRARPPPVLSAGAEKLSVGLRTPPGSHEEERAEHDQGARPGGEEARVGPREGAPARPARSVAVASTAGGDDRHGGLVDVAHGQAEDVGARRGGDVRDGGGAEA